MRTRSAGKCVALLCLAAAASPAVAQQGPPAHVHPKNDTETLPAPAAAGPAGELRNQSGAGSPTYFSSPYHSLRHFLSWAISFSCSSMDFLAISFSSGLFECSRACLADRMAPV